MRVRFHIGAGLLAGALTLSGLLTVGASAAMAAPDPADYRSQGDALRREGDYEGAIRQYRQALATGGLDAEILSDIGSCYKALRRFRDADAAYAQAVAAAPGDRELRDDLTDLRASHGLVLRGWLGGTEPGTSRQAFDAEARYAGINRLDLVAGYGYTDQVYYHSHKGFASAYWFYRGVSYLKADFTLRRYSYPDNPTVQRPTPDTNAYATVPRGELELAHWLSPNFRGGLDYQLFAPTFFFDPASRAVNHKLSAEAYWLAPDSPLRLSMFVAALRDPDPNATRIAGRGGALATSVVYRTTSLVGGAVALEGERWGAEVRYLPNRDLDNSYDWSLLSMLDLRPVESLGIRLQHVYDTYANASNYPGRVANIGMAQARWRLHPRLSVGAGYKYVEAPTRRGGTVLLSLEYGTGWL